VRSGFVNPTEQLQAIGRNMRADNLRQGAEEPQPEAVLAENPIRRTSDPAMISDTPPIVARAG